MHKVISAELVPLGGKYYGSEIRLTDQHGNEALMVVWVNSVSDYTPSERELEGWDEAEFGEYEISDDHYESATALAICHAIVEALDGLEV